MPNNPYQRSYAFDIVKDARDARSHLKKLAMEKGQTMEYQFTQRQLYKLLNDTIELYRENIDVHGQEDLTAQCEAVAGTLEGLDAEAELAELGEVSEATFTPVYDAELTRENQARAAEEEERDRWHAAIDAERERGSK